LIRVKICGVTSPDDAILCAKAGADAVGMLVEVKTSPRSIAPDKAGEIVKALPPFVTPVIVMMPENHEDAINAAKKCRPGAIQLHGDEPPEMLERIKDALPGIRIIKAIHVGEGEEAEKCKKYESIADAILLDTASPLKGGTGITHDWSVSRNIASMLKIPVLLAGGLTPENVGEAVRGVRPYGVDVSSGVEMKGNRFSKDISRVTRFILNARRA
jgi:phosphoribosylanthranilate isomerase